MRTKDRLTFKLTTQNNGSEVVDEYIVHPCYDSVKLSKTKEDDKVYFTNKVSGSFVFLGDEAMLIHRQSLLCRFTLVIYDRGVELVRGTFRKTDCKTDLDHQTIEVSIDANDLYSEIESNNSEYNVVKWGLQKYGMGIAIQPSINMYPLGSGEVYIFQSLLGFTKVASNAMIDSRNDITSTYGFAKKIYGAFYNESTGHRYVLSSEILNDSSDEWVFTNIDSPSHSSITISRWRGHADSFGITLSGDGYSYSGIFISNGTNIGRFPIDALVALNEKIIRFGTIIESSQGSGDQYGRIIVRLKYKTWVPCARIVGGDTDSLDRYLPNDDIITTSNRKSSYIGCGLVLSSNTTTEESEYQIPDTNTYFAPPDSENEYRAFYADSWQWGLSLWMPKSYMTQTIINTYAAQASLGDWYLLGDVIKGMLAQMDSSILFDCDTAHSQFLFASTNPVSGEVQNPIYVIQKSNLLNYTYQYPAWSALLTWNRLETMLKNLFNCHYDIYIDNLGRKHLRIEHYLFYANGNSYQQTDRSVVDLRQVYDCGNGKPMSYRTNRWEYDQDRPYTRWEFQWMDTQSEPFAAFPIQVPKSLMIYNRNTIADMTVDWFSADIDFMLTESGEVRSDGFVIAMSNGGTTDDDRMVCQGLVRIGPTEYYCQNYRMALGYLQKKFLLHGIYSTHVTMDNTEYLVTVPTAGRKRMRKQSVVFQLPNMVMPSEESLYVTDAGEGQVESLEIDLTDMKVTATLRQSTENL